MMNEEKFQVRTQLQGGDLYDTTATFHILVWILRWWVCSHFHSWLRAVDKTILIDKWSGRSLAYLAKKAVFSIVK